MATPRALPDDDDVVDRDATDAANQDAVKGGESRDIDGRRHADEKANDEHGRAQDDSSGSDDEEDGLLEDADDGGWDLPEWSADTFDLDAELRINPKLDPTELDELYAWSRKQRSFPELRKSDLVKFLHSCSYDVLAAMQCMNYYFSARASIGALFHDRDISHPRLHAQLQVLDFIVCPRLAPDGCRVIVNALKDPDPANYVFEDHQKLMLMMMDAVVMAEPTLPGVYMVYDLNLGQISHFWKFGFFMQRKLFAYLQAGLPMLLKGTVLLRTPSYINKVMKVLRTVGDKKRLDETVMFEGDDFSGLHEVIPRECLPSDYGGSLPSRAELHDQTCQRLGSLLEVFQREEVALRRR